MFGAVKAKSKTRNLRGARFNSHVGYFGLPPFSVGGEIPSQFGQKGTFICAVEPAKKNVAVKCSISTPQL
jgi:hypothetical protein